MEGGAGLMRGLVVVEEVGGGWGGISRWCRCEWAISISARAGLSSSRVEVQGFNSTALAVEKTAPLSSS